MTFSKSVGGRSTGGQFGTSVFNKVVRWHRLGEVENVYVAYNFSHFAIFLPKFIKIGGHLTKLKVKVT